MFGRLTLAVDAALGVRALTARLVLLNEIIVCHTRYIMGQERLATRLPELIEDDETKLIPLPIRSDLAAHARVVSYQEVQP